MRVAFGALLSHWRRHPLQLATLLLGLALATALWSGVQAINAEARASYDRAAGGLTGGGLDRIVRGDGGSLTTDDFVALRRAGWPVSPLIEGRLAGSDLQLIGIEPLTLPREAALGPKGDGAALPDFLTPEGRLLVHPETAARLADADLPPRIVDASVQPGTAVTDIALAARLLGMERQITALILAPDAPPGDPGKVVPRLERRAAASSDLARLTDSFHLNLTAFGLLAFVVGLFIVHAAIGLAFEQRRPMLRTLRALGVSARALTALLLVEVVGLSLLAGVVGLALGYLVAAMLLPDVAATLRGLYGADVPGTLSLRPVWWLSGLGIAVAGALLAAGQGLWQAARLPLLALAQPRAWARASAARQRAMAVAGAALMAAAGVLVLTGGGLWAGFGVLATLLLGAALMLPAALAGLAALASRVFPGGAVSGWFWADTRQQLPGLSLALMALLLALAANIGVGTMVSSFRSTFTGWLDQRLASELYLTLRNEDEAASVSAWLAQRTEAILPIADAEVVLGGRPGEVYGVADHPTYRQNWPMLTALPSAWDDVAAGRGILANEQFFRSVDLALGSQVALPGGALPVVGVYSDYGNPRPQVLIGTAAFEQRFPDVPVVRFGLRVDPTRAEALKADLQATFGLPASAMVDQSAIKALSLEIFERTFAVTAALNVLTLGVAAIAILSSLLTLAGLRLPQLAPLWAMGLTRRRLAGMELLRLLVLAALTWVLAVPLGLALAWVLLAVVNVEAFGWRLPMHVFPADWLRLGALAVLAAGLAALFPALRLARIAPTRLLKVFADER